MAITWYHHCDINTCTFLSALSTALINALLFGIHYRYVRRN